MLQHILRRLVFGLISLFVLVTIMFFAMHIIMPGDYTSQFAMVLSPEEQQEMRHSLGIDLPLGEQYVLWLKDIAQGTLGNTYVSPGRVGLSVPKRVTVIEVLGGLAAPTVLVFVAGLGLAYALGHWLGSFAGWRGPTALTDGLTFAAIAGYAFFPPALAFLLQWLFVKKLAWVPEWALFSFKFSREYKDIALPDLMVWMVLGILGGAALAAVGVWLLRRLSRWEPPVPLVALYAVLASVGMWSAFGFGPPALSLMRLAAIPIFAMIVLSTGEMMVISRASVTDTREEQYVSTARAIGLAETRVRDHHAVPNAILPILTRVGISLPYLLGGLAIIESSVKWPGVGSALFNAAVLQDIPLVLGLLLFIGLVTLVMRLALDIAYALLEPRLRAPSSKG